MKPWSWSLMALPPAAVALATRLVDLAVARAGEREQDFARAFRVRDRARGKGLEEGLGDEHGVDRVLLDHQARGLVVGEPRVEAEAEAREEFLRALEVLHRQVDEDLPHFSGSLVPAMTIQETPNLSATMPNDLAKNVSPRASAPGRPARAHRRTALRVGRVPRLKRESKAGEGRLRRGTAIGGHDLRARRCGRTSA